MRAASLLRTGVLLLLSSSASAQDSANVDLTGTWLFTVTTDAGSGTPTVTLRQTGDTLTGNYSSQFFGEAQLSGTVKGRTFSVTFSTAVEGQTLTVTYSGTIEGINDLKGSVDIGGMAGGTFTAKRKPPPGEPVHGVAPVATAQLPGSRVGH